MDRQRDGQRRWPVCASSARIGAPTTTTSCYYIDLGNPAQPNVGAPIKPIVETIDAEYTPIGNYQSRVYLRSDKDAPNRQDHRHRSRASRSGAWKVVVPEQPHAIENAALIGGRIVVHYLVDVQSRLRMFGLDGAPKATFRCRASARWSRSGGRADQYGRLVLVQLAAVAVHGLSHTTSRREARTPFEAPTPPIDASAVRNQARCSRRRRTARACRFSSRTQEGPAARRPQSDHALRLRRLFDQRAARLSIRRAGVARAGRRVRHRQHARRRRIRRGVAQGRLSREEAERVRRLHRRRRASGQGALHVAAIGSA